MALLYIFAGAPVVVGGVLFGVGISRARLRSRIKRTPTTPIRHLVQNQFAEIVGRISCDQALKIPDSDQPCVYYHYELEQHHPYGGHEGTWVAMDKREQRTAFTLTDASGSIEVDPAEAKIDAPMVVDRYVQPGEELPFGAENVARAPSNSGLAGLARSGAAQLGKSLGMGDEVSRWTNQRIRIRALPVDQDAHVLCSVERGPDGSRRAVKGSTPFFISTKSEQELLATLGRTVRVCLIVGPILLIVGAAALLVRMLWH